jgi:quercetin dioxygenase-like cupin family protein
MGELNDKQILITCADLESALGHFVEHLGFRLEMIMPADSPTVALVSGHGIRVRLEAGVGVAETRFDSLNSGGDIAAQLIALGGEWKEITETPLIVPSVKPELIITRYDEGKWVKGRAGMEYRDLIPGRLGGAVIASHIRIQKGGPVPDYVHYHKVLFQMIYCKAGWVRVVYEDQGPPFVMNAGDCVLQPPGIRHRVLECSDNFEVIEVGMPAIHETWRDHEMELPNLAVNPDRIWNGQRFVSHVASEAEWLKGEGFEYRDTGISEATNGLADVRILKASSRINMAKKEAEDLALVYILGGEVAIEDDLGTLTVIHMDEGFPLWEGAPKFIVSENSELLKVSIHF